MSELEFKPRSSMVPSLLPFTSILYFKQEQLQLTKTYEDDRHGGLKRGLPHKPRCTQLLCPGPVNTPSPSSHLMNPGTFPKSHHRSHGSISGTPREGGSFPGLLDTLLINPDDPLLPEAS